MDANTKAYLAGLLDATAFLCFEQHNRRKINKTTPKYKVCIEVQGRLPFLKSMQSYYGGNILKCRDCNKIQYGARKTEQILSDIRPYLFLNKKKAAVIWKALNIKKRSDYSGTRYSAELNILLKKFRLLKKSQGSPSLLSKACNYFYIAGIVDQSGCPNIFTGYYRKNNKDPNLYYKKHLQITISTQFSNLLQYMHQYIGGTINKKGNVLNLQMKDFPFFFNHIYPLLKIKRPICNIFQKTLQIRRLPGKLFDDAYQAIRAKYTTEIKFPVYIPETLEQKLLNFHPKESGEKRFIRNIRQRLRSVWLSPNRAAQTIGCSLEFLKAWLEIQFDEHMSWENYGLWHVDHKKPVSKFNLNLESDRKQVNHFTNLQPLWAEDNLKKGNKLMP